MAVDVMDEVVDTNTTVDTTEKYPTPDFSNLDAVGDFELYLQNHLGNHGVKALLRNVEVYRRNAGIADRYLTKVRNTLARLNGQRTSAQRDGDSKRGLTSAARKFYESCTDKVLDAQLKIADLNPKLYADRKEKINALMEWHKRVNK